MNNKIDPRRTPDTGPVPGSQEPQPAAHDAAVGTRVLVVEDNPVNQQIARMALQRMGFEVTLAGNGLEAVESVAQQRFDLVLMDWQMPVMDGIEATRRIREAEAQGGRERLPIVAVTAHEVTGDTEILSTGMDDLLAKPFTRAELEAVLARWLRPLP